MVTVRATFSGGDAMTATLTAPLFGTREAILEAEHRKPIRKRLREYLDKKLPRRLTPAEREEIEAERRAKAAEKAQFNELLAEAREYARDLTDTLTELGICYRSKISERKEGYERITEVMFERPYRLSTEAIYLKVDLRGGNRPRNVRVMDLENPETLKDLSQGCGKQVKCKYTPEGGFWYIIEREYGVGGIPSHVKYDDLMQRRPASADGLTIGLGVTENKKQVFRSFGQMYSMLIAGTIGGGKSNELNSIICQLIRYNSPERLKLVLVDLKGGVEFSFYNELPHLLTLPTGAHACKSCGVEVQAPEKDFEGKDVCPLCNAAYDVAPVRKPLIVEHREQVPETFGWLINEGERRMALLKESKCKSIGQYNYKNRSHAMPHIMCVIDEWADVKLSKEVGAKAEEMLINIASRFRAVGIHVILCTQVPNKEVVSMRVKNVLPAKLVFSCPDQFASMLLLGNYDAQGLEPAGRAIFDWAGKRSQVQTPFISNATVEAMVAGAIAGEFSESDGISHDVTDQEIFEWSISEWNGDLDQRSVYNKYRHRGMSYEQAIAFCADYENQVVVVGSQTYKLMPGSGSRPRRLLPCDDTGTLIDKEGAKV